MNGWETGYSVTSKRFQNSRLSFEWTSKGYKCRYDGLNLELSRVIPDLHEAKKYMLKIVVNQLKDTINRMETELIELEKEDNNTLDR